VTGSIDGKGVGNGAGSRVGDKVIDLSVGLGVGCGVGSLNNYMHSKGAVSSSYKLSNEIAMAKLTELEQM
jgi:2-polyprenyl-3-methyl-5-hydroxy-6-metoxy-1,4-benzoquinol methylase